MIKRPRHTQQRARRTTNEPALTFTVFDETANEIGELAAKAGVSFETLMHEALALLFRREREPLPLKLAEYLEKHGRSVPPPRPARTKREFN